MQCLGGEVICLFQLYWCGRIHCYLTFAAKCACERRSQSVTSDRIVGQQRCHTHSLPIKEPAGCNCTGNCNNRDLQRNATRECGAIPKYRYPTKNQLQQRYHENECYGTINRESEKSRSKTNEKRSRE